MKKRKLFLDQATENFFRFGVWIFLLIFLFFVVTLISAENNESQTENKISYSAVYDQKTNQYYLKLNYFSENQIKNTHGSNGSNPFFQKSVKSVQISEQVVYHNL